MREQLCFALAKHADQVLTQDVARAILDDIFPDLSYAPEQFGRMDYAKYSIQAERFADVLPELERLHAEQWAETERARINVALDPDYKHMAESERSGQLIQFTARDSVTWELVANMRIYLFHDLHAKQFCCREDTFFVFPKHRGSFLAVRLWQFVEKAAVSLGVREVRFSSKLVNKADRMARYLKYTPVGTEFIKVFNEAGQPVKE